jgi:ketosteroid isomerase-like protein
MGHLDFELLDLRALGRDGAIVLGRWRLSSTPQAGEGVFSLAFLRTPAGWRIVHDHTSLAAP